MISDEERVEAFLDGLTLGRLERQRRLYDFPVAVSPDDEYLDEYQDDDAEA